MKLKQNSFKDVLFQPKQNAKAVKRSSCFSQSQPVSAAYTKLLSMMVSNFSHQTWRSYALLVSVKSN